MSKGAVIAMVVVGAGVILVGGIALAAPKPVIRPDLGPPPPPPPTDSLGRYLVREGINAAGEALNEAKPYLTGGEDPKAFAAKCAVNPVYCGGKQVVYAAKKVWNSIF